MRRMICYCSEKDCGGYIQPTALWLAKDAIVVSGTCLNCGKQLDTVFPKSQLFPKPIEEKTSEQISKSAFTLDDRRELQAFHILLDPPQSPPNSHAV